MLRTIVLLSVTSLLAVAPAAEAATRPTFKCMPLDKFKAIQHDPITFTPLTVGQFHFLEGIYAASPITPDGLPPGDGAQLAKLNGNSAVVWTRGKDACVSLIVIAQGQNGGPPMSAYLPMPLTDQLVKELDSIKTGKSEEVPAPTTSQGDEPDLKL